jgi:hypothetical protein
MIHVDYLLDGLLMTGSLKPGEGLMRYDRVTKAVYIHPLAAVYVFLAIVMREW